MGYQTLEPTQVLEEAPTGLVVLGLDGGVAYLNAVARRCLGDDERAALVDRPERLDTGERVLRIDWQEARGRWVGALHDVTAEWARRQAAERRARTDALTGLGNRASFEDELRANLSHAARSRGQCVLLLIDLDRFKNVNDTLGHGIGDMLLVKVAQRIRHCLREHDAALRLGGDEFAVLLSEVGASAGEAATRAEAVAKRLIDLLGRTFMVDGHTVRIGCSVGVAMGDQADAHADLVKHADIAMYRAKEAGRGCHVFFEPGMDRAMRERRALEQELGRAVALEQFVLHYQPLFDFERNRIEGWEALLRWEHPERGLIAPADFIALAEETQIIVPLGEWVLRTACRAATRLPDHMTVSVNVSPAQFAVGDLVMVVADALDRAGLPADRLEIEITESILLSDAEAALETLRRLRALGVRVALDDFGTGYASLSRLQQFPFDVIKIDQSFVRGDGNVVENTAIVRAVAALGRHLGMQTTAEGIETPEQLESVRADGCSKAQGFLLSKPVPEDRIPSIIERVAREHAAPGALGRPLLTPPPLAPSEQPSLASSDEVERDDAPLAAAGPLFKLVYRSRSAIMESEAGVRAEFERILDVSQRNNARDGITGALMFSDACFVQVLEGPAEAVERTFERIQLDPRHGDVTVLDARETDTRQFANWSMAHVAPEGAQLPELADIGRVSGFDDGVMDADAITRRLRDLLLQPT